MRQPFQRSTLVFFALAALVLSASIGLRDPWPADEPRFTLAAKHMVESGHWLFTQRGNELYSDKPPLFMWLQAGLFEIFRSWRLAFLLPSLIAALGTLFCVFDLTRRLYSETHARVAAAAVLVTGQFTYQMTRAQIDPVLLLFCTLSAYAFLRHALIAASARWYLLGWFCAGLGIMTKGVGFLPLFLLLVLWPMRRYRFAGLVDPGTVRGPKYALLGLLVLMLPIALWLVPMAWQAYAGNDPQLRAYADDLLFRQTGTRLVNAWHHFQPPYYFLLVILSTWLPLILALPWLLGSWRVAWHERDAKVLLPLFGSLLIIGFFTLSSGKRDMYILPALPLFVLAAAPYLAQIIQRIGPKRLGLAFALILSGALIAAGASAIWAKPNFALRLEADRGLGVQVWYLLSGIGLAALSAALWFRRQGAYAAFAAMCVLWLGYGWLLSPALNGANSGRDLMHKVARRVGQSPWAMLGWREQHLLQAQGRAPTLFGFKRDQILQDQDAFAWLRADPQRWLFADRSRLAHCARANYPLPAFAITNRRVWVLIQRKDFPPECTPEALTNHTDVSQAAQSALDKDEFE
jgi:4-amino-4-deoxy-L-arabinose transferase-like glycosyltransferase